MKRVPTVKPYSRRTMRVLAMAQALLILVSLMVPIAAQASISSVVIGPQAPNPVNAGSSATYSVAVANDSPSLTRGISIEAISGLPAGASFVSTCATSVPGGTTGTVTVTVSTTVATPGGTFPLTMTATRWSNGSGVCNGTSIDSVDAGTALVVTAGPTVATTTVITSDLPDPSVVNAAYTVNVSVTRASGSTTITGTVTVSDGTASCTDPTATGGAAATVTYSCALTSTTAGAKTLTASFPANAPLGASSGTAAHTVSPASQTITFPALAGVRLDQAAPTTAATASSGLAVAYSTVSTACSVTSGGIITMLHAGSCTILANQAGNANYNAAAQVSRAFTIAKGNQSITFSPLSTKTTADPPFTVSATASSGLTVVFASTTPAVCTVAGTTVTLVGAGTCTITANQVGNADWNAAATVTRNFTVTAAPLVGTTTVITSDLPDPSTVNTPYTVDVSVTRASGSSTITGTVTVSDGTASCTDTTPTGGNAATVTYSCALTSTTTGAKTLTASFPANVLFSASSGTAAHTVKATQTITFPALAGVRLDQAAPTTAATASSGLAVTYSTVSTACSVTSGGVITLLGVGTCTIDADQAGNGAYAAAPQISRSFAIAKGDQSITFAALGGKVMFDAPFAISATATSGLTVAFASNSASVCTVAGTTVTLVSSGTCSITASQAGNVNWNAAAPNVTRTFTVAQAASSTVVTCPVSVVYDGSAQTPCTVSVTGAGGLSLSPTPSYTQNTDAGTVTAAYTFAGDANHTGSSDSTTFEISQATSTTVVTCPVSVVYDGSAQTPCTVSVTGAGGLSLSPTPSYTQNTDAGTATADYAFAGDANHTGSSDSTTFDITQAASSTVVTCPVSVVYDGTAKTPCTVSVTGAGGLSLSPTPIYTLNTNVGTAAADYTFAGDANHTGSSDSTTFDITQAASSTIVTCPVSVVYDGSAQTPCTVSVTGAGGLSLSPTPIYTANTNVGTVTAAYTFAGDANHTGSSDSTTFEISQATSTTVVTCPVSVVYDGSAQTPCTVSVTGAGGLSLSPTPSYTQNTDAGTVTAAYTFAGDANHTGSSDSTTFEISQATSTTVVTCPVSVVYDGSAQTPCTVSVTGAGGLSLSPTPSYTQNTDAGTATADYAFAGDANHTGSSDSTTFDITTADSTTVVTFEAGPYIYTGTEFTATAVVTGGGGLDQAVQVVLSGDCTNVTVSDGCTATATFAGDGTYNGSSDSQSITITQASQTIDFHFDADASEYAGTFELTATADSSLPVTFTSLTTDRCTVSDTTATVLSAGACTIEAAQPGNVNFAAAAPVTETFEVTVAGAAPAPPDTSLSGSSPLTTGVEPISWLMLVGALMAVALSAIFVLMTFAVIKRQREQDQADRVE